MQRTRLRIQPGAEVYAGPAVLGEIHAGLAVHLARDGFASIAEAVGADHR